MEADNTENVSRKKQRQKFVRNVNFSTKTHNLREGLKLLLKRPIKPTDLSTEINVTGYSMWKFMTTSIMDVAPDTPAAHFRNLHSKQFGLCRMPSFGSSGNGGIYL
ncbi:uncharacterized protein ACR2FA_005695 [Aphomia sociella]